MELYDDRFEKVLEISRRKLDKTLRNQVISVRSILDTFEFILQNLQEHISRIQDCEGLEFSPPEMERLSVKAYFGRDNSEDENSEAFLRDLRFRFELFADLYFTGMRIDTASENWARLVQTSKLIGRVTNPRCSEDFSIPQVDVSMAKEAARWFSQQIELLYDAARAALETELVGLKRAALRLDKALDNVNQVRDDH